MKVKKIIGLFFLLTGVIGFFVATQNKYDQAIFEEKIHSKELKTFEVSLEAGQNYHFRFWGEDSEMKENSIDAKFVGKIQIYNQKEQLLFNQTLIADHPYEFAERMEAKGETEYLHSPKFGESVKVLVQIIEGEQLTIEIFENLDSESDALPGIFIILAVIGLFIWLSSRKRNKK